MCVGIAVGIVLVVLVVATVPAAGHAQYHRGGAGGVGGGAVSMQHATQGMPVVRSDGSTGPHSESTLAMAGYRIGGVPRG
jgi:hypothetical protein